MITPYKFRICAALEGHAPVEVMRSSAKYSQAAWNFWTRDLSQAWTVWTEHTLDDKHCLSDRPKVRYNPADHRDRLPLTREEKALIPDFIP